MLTYFLDVPQERYLGWRETRELGSRIGRRVAAGIKGRETRRAEEEEQGPLGTLLPRKESPSGLSWACCRLVNILCSAQKGERGSSFSEHEETGWK